MSDKQRKGNFQLWKKCFAQNQDWSKFCVQYLKGTLQTFSERFQQRWGHGPLRADTPERMGSFSGMKPRCLEHRINSPICYPLLLRYMTWYLWLMSHVWWWFQIIPPPLRSKFHPLLRGMGFLYDQVRSNIASKLCPARQHEMGKRGLHPAQMVSPRTFGLACSICYPHLILH